MIDSELANTGAQELDPSGYQVSDLKDTEIQREDPHFKADTVFFNQAYTLAFLLEISLIFRWVQVLKIQFWLPTRKTCRNLLLDQSQSLSYPMSLTGCWESVLLKMEEEMFLTIFIEWFWGIGQCMWFCKKKLIRKFHFFINFFEKIYLKYKKRRQFQFFFFLPLAAARFFRYHLKKTSKQALKFKIKSGISCKNEYRKVCLNGEWYCLIDVGFLGLKPFMVVVWKTMWYVYEMELIWN